jgi:hypothetical protein
MWVGGGGGMKRGEFHIPEKEGKRNEGSKN